MCIISYACTSKIRFCLISAIYVHAHTVIRYPSNTQMHVICYLSFRQFGVLKKFGVPKEIFDSSILAKFWPCACCYRAYTKIITNGPHSPKFYYYSIHYIYTAPLQSTSNYRVSHWCSATMNHWLISKKLEHAKWEYYIRQLLL